MSTPEQSTLLAPSLPSFGGYAPQQGELQGVTFWPRAGARIVDMIVHYIVAFISAFLFGIMLLVVSGGHASPAVLAKMDHTGVLGFILGLLGSFAYHVVFSSVHGSTIGKIAFSMVVVQEDGSPCTLRSALISELGYFVDALFFGLIAYSAMKDDIRQQRHGDSWAHAGRMQARADSPQKAPGSRQVRNCPDFRLARGCGVHDDQFSDRHRRMKKSGGKWALTLVLLCVAAGLWWWPARPVKVELLPFSNVPPAWDGSQPWLIISPIAGSGRFKFKVEIAMVKPTVRHTSPVNEFVVNLRNGNFKLLQTDLFVPDVMPLNLTRTYFAWNRSIRAFGIGMNHAYDICPTGTRFPYTYMNLNLEDGYEVYMPRVSKGTGYADAVFRHDRSSSEFFGALVAWNGNGWTMTFRDGAKIYFPEACYARNFAQGAPIEMLDAEGHRIRLKRNSVRNLEELISPSGHTIDFKYDSADRIVEARDDAGEVRHYFYDRTGHLGSVSDGSKVLYRFEYQRLMTGPDNDPYLLTAVLDGDWNLLLRNTFLNGRVLEQTVGDGSKYKYEYQFKGAELIQTKVTFPGTEQKGFSFQNGILTSRN